MIELKHINIEDLTLIKTQSTKIPPNSTWEIYREQEIEALYSPKHVIDIQFYLKILNL